MTATGSGNTGGRRVLRAVCVFGLMLGSGAAVAQRDAQPGHSEQGRWQVQTPEYRRYAPSTADSAGADGRLDGWRDSAATSAQPVGQRVGDRRATLPPTTIYFDVQDQPSPAAAESWQAPSQTPPQPAREPASRSSGRDTGVPPPDHAHAGQLPRRERAPVMSSSGDTHAGHTHAGGTGPRSGRPGPRRARSGQQSTAHGGSAHDFATDVPSAAERSTFSDRPRQYPPATGWPSRYAPTGGGLDGGMISASPQPGDAHRATPQASGVVQSGVQSRPIAPTTVAPGDRPSPLISRRSPPVQQSLPPLSAAVPSAARAGLNTLGAGDSIRVAVFGQDDLTTETVVGDDGSISLPLVDRVRVGGLSPQAAGDRIAAAYESGGFLKNPQVSVTIETLRSRQVSVLGAVASPGRFPLESEMSLLDALALAGGIAQEGSEQVLLLRPAGDQSLRYTVDISGMLTGSDRRVVTLGAGDTVFVPEAPKFYIYGEVQRPNAYPMREQLSVMQAISLGGGLTDRGSDSRIDIRRTGTDGATQTVSADLEDVVQPGDVIYVRERLF